MELNTGPKLSKDQTGLLKYWVTKCSDGNLPLRRDVSPAELIFCLPSISIIERRPCGTDVFRMTGSALRDILGYECRGQLVDESCGRTVPWYEAINQAIKTKSPVFGHSPAGHLRTHQWMRLPLQQLENGRQPVLCYDRIQLEKEGTPEVREAMFVTANAFRRARPLEHTAA